MQNHWGEISNFHEHITPLIIPASFRVFCFGGKLVDNGDYRKRKLFFPLGLFKENKFLSQICLKLGELSLRSCVLLYAHVNTSGNL